MNLLELKLKRGDKYVDQDGRVWVVEEFSTGGLDLISKFENSVGAVHTVEDIQKMDFQPYVDWEKVTVDTKVLVRDGTDDEWTRRYFHRYNKRNPLKFCTFAKGLTAWNSKKVCPNTCWRYCKLWEGSEEQKEEGKEHQLLVGATGIERKYLKELTPLFANIIESNPLIARLMSINEIGNGNTKDIAEDITEELILRIGLSSEKSKESEEI